MRDTRRDSMQIKVIRVGNVDTRVECASGSFRPFPIKFHIIKSILKTNSPRKILISILTKLSRAAWIFHSISNYSRDHLMLWPDCGIPFHRSSHFFWFDAAEEPIFRLSFPLKNCENSHKAANSKHKSSCHSEPRHSSSAHMYRRQIKL